MKKNDGYMRITCCGGEAELRDLADRLENRLLEVRKQKQEFLKKELAALVNKIMVVNSDQAKTININMGNLISEKHVTALDLMKTNKKLQNLLSEARINFGKLSYEEKNQYAIIIQSQFRGYQARKRAHQWNLFAYDKWKMCIEKHFFDAKIKYQKRR